MFDITAQTFFETIFILFVVVLAVPIWLVVKLDDDWEHDDHEE